MFDQIVKRRNKRRWRSPGPKLTPEQIAFIRNSSTSFPFMGGKGGHYGLIVNTADTVTDATLDAALDGVGPLLTTLNGNGDPAADTMEAAANGTAIDGGPIEPPVDGAPDSAAAMDAIINGNGAAVATNGNGNGNGTPSTYAEKGIIGTYVSDIKTHPVAMASAFAVGWFLARR